MPGSGNLPRVAGRCRKSRQTDHVWRLDFASCINTCYQTAGDVAWACLRQVIQASFTDSGGFALGRAADDCWNSDLQGSCFYALTTCAGSALSYIPGRFHLSSVAIMFAWFLLGLFSFSCQRAHVQLLNPLQRMFPNARNIVCKRLQQVSQAACTVSG